VLRRIRLALSRRVATPYDRVYARALTGPTGAALGFFVVVRGRKP
jgi:hypothetical protein